MKKILLCTVLSALACSVPSKADIKFTNKSDKDVTIFLEANNKKEQKFDRILVELKKNGEQGSSSSITQEKFEEIAQDQYNVFNPVGAGNAPVFYTLMMRETENPEVQRACVTWIPAFSSPVTEDKPWVQLMTRDVFNKEFSIRPALGDPSILLCSSF